MKAAELLNDRNLLSTVLFLNVELVEDRKNNLPSNVKRQELQEAPQLAIFQKNWALFEAAIFKCLKHHRCIFNSEKTSPIRLYSFLPLNLEK